MAVRRRTLRSVDSEHAGRVIEPRKRSVRVERFKSGTYHAPPVRRVHIPKGQGKTRPIGISAFEDKLVQDAVREVLEAVYEQDFLDCSYGFRPGRSAHDAVRALTRAVDGGEANWILEIDIASFFDSVCRKQLVEMLQRRVADGSIVRLVGKCLHVGVLDGVEFITPDEGMMLWSDNSLIPVTAKHSSNAMQLLDYYYDPKVAAELAAYVNYICPVAGAQEAMADIDKDLADNPLIFPDSEMLKKTTVFKALSETEEKEYQSKFQAAIGA